MDKPLATPLDRLELPAAVAAALARLKRKTVRGLVALRECDLWDALDDDAALDVDDKDAAIRATKLVLATMGLELDPSGRFESFDEMSRWVQAAASELGMRTDQSPSHRGRPMVTVHVAEHGGSVTLEEAVNWLGVSKFERITPFREATGASAPTRELAWKCEEVARRVLRRARALADEQG